MITKEDVQYQLDIAYGKQASKYTTIIERSQVPQEFGLYHVSTDARIRAFVPRFSTRLFPGETTAIPRISTCPTLLQCFLGRGDPFYENQPSTGSKDKPTLYTIYGFDWDYAVKPEKSLVPDVAYTDEHWLLACTPETRVFIPIIMGEMFLSKIFMLPVGDMTVRDYEFMLRLNKSLCLMEDVILEKGFYRILVKGWVQPWMTFSQSNVTYEKVKEGEYLLAYQRRNQKITKKKKE